MIKATGIFKSYNDLKVLQGIDISIETGEIVSIVGPSGAGKSTLLHIIGTLDKADAGYVEINGVKVGELNAKKLAAFRNKNIGFIFQFHHLLPEFTALENVCVPAFIGNTGKKEAEKKAQELLEYLGLKDRMNHKPKELSGGNNSGLPLPEP